jgi:glucosamine--fructose-6-phosphate aminotransferase (isomerizing)
MAKELLAKVPDKIDRYLEFDPGPDQEGHREVVHAGELACSSAAAYNYPTALEGALKLKEISYIHAEGMPAAR